MSFSEIKKVLYGKRRECNILALLSRIDPILDIPKGKLIARKELDHPFNNRDVIEVRWQIILD